MTPQIIDAVYQHAEHEVPRECCGLIVRSGDELHYEPCRNIAENSLDFLLDPEDWVKIEDMYEIVGIAHSHINKSPEPSIVDRIGCERSNLPWLIVSWPSKANLVLSPSGYVTPLKGRPFIHGVLDCYSLVRDYFKLMCEIQLNDYPRETEWWFKGYNLYMENFAKEGFQEVYDAPKCHDLFLMQICGSPVINHAAIYLGNMKILHHLENRLSREDVYGGYWQKHTVKTIRHQRLV